MVPYLHGGLFLCLQISPSSLITLTCTHLSKWFHPLSPLSTNYKLMAHKFRSLPQTAPMYFRFYQIHTPSILFVIHHISHNLITPQWFPLPYKSFLSAPESMLIISHIPCVFSQFYIINNPSCFYVSVYYSSLSLHYPLPKTLHLGAYL